jgi:co-chaperonin GroES (HSP10)
MLAPVGKRILVRPLEEKHATLIITTKKPSKFVVISIGDEVTKVINGDIVYLEKNYGVDIEHDNEKFIVVDESSVLVKIME